MAIQSKFRSNRLIRVAPQNLIPLNLFNWLGLDMYSPDEQLDDRRSPYGKNFRLYTTDNTKRVAISKRAGHSFYSVPVGETEDQTQTSTTGAADKSLTLTTWLGQKFTAGATGRLTKVEVRLKNDASGTGPAIVAIYSDSSGSPGTLLGTTSVLSSSITSSYAYISARLLEAPSVTSGTAYWIVVYVQADGSNNYKWSSTTTATTAKTSADSGTTWTATSYALNFKTHVSTAGAVKGVHRFYRSTASPVTLMAFGTAVYTVNDVTGAVTSIKGSLAAAATHYDFASVNNKTYWTNGNDAPQVYDGSTVATAGGSPPVTSTNVEVHANKLFYLQDGTNYVIYSDAAAYETFTSTSFIYVPAPTTADPVIKMVSSQGTMVFFTRNTKHVLYGTSNTDFLLRESPAKKGAVAAGAIAKDDNYIYFLNDDGHVYRYDGSRDEQLFSRRIIPVTKNIASTSIVRLFVHDKKLYITYPSAGNSASNHRLVYDLEYNEWLSDEETYCNYGISWTSQSDTGQLVVASSLVGALYYGETGTNDVGKPIDFEYRSKYFSFGSPAAKHRVKRYYSFLQTQSTNHTVDCQVDVDGANSPTSNVINVNQTGYEWGDSGTVWGSFTWGASNELRTRIAVPGANTKHQFRFVQSGVDNKVDLLGISLYIAPRRPV